MLIVLFLWLLAFVISFVVGFSVVKLLLRFGMKDVIIGVLGPDELFFFGLLSLSFVAGLLSIFIPIGTKVLSGVIILTVLLFFINFRELKSLAKEALSKVSRFRKTELWILGFILFFIIAAVAHKITLGDTESYHAQCVQWIRKYAVVPGLGNIHGRFAFNSMFFVISGLFTFQIKDILVFPLNGICYIVLIIKLSVLYSEENKSGTKWKAVFYALTILISLVILIPWLNSPSPDVICSILIMYTFLLFIAISERNNSANRFHIILLNLLVFTCIGYKLSSAFLVLTLFFFLKTDFIKRSLISIITGILIISPFVIRNYYLSGYLIYPFPGIDIFNVDWKIPLDEVRFMNTEIGSWAKISTLPSLEVAGMRFWEWIIPWFSSLSIFNKLLVSVNLFSVFSFLIMLFKKDFNLAIIQFIIIVNLLLWLNSAPDPRFAYGFLFPGFSLTIAYLIKQVEMISDFRVYNFMNIGLLCFLAIIAERRISLPIGTITNPSSWIVPAPFGTVETKEYFSGFHYRVPVPEGGCYNVEIPCTPYPLSNIVLRGKGLQDGFKVYRVEP
jgi:hypothetical protein